ncbi:MAG: hypothetical protein BGO21_00690 [Dyadobacter sp. 50-39]|uniref:vitamin K epoxide reductase family protein n=1 Tax=Dyadobacter sp. 50-39 TaxID=1895756 RepID=UPI0009612687|nr:thioredoxin domain-containing protein [Dyadobacter sp. 50-39]OJV16203.1 MAG: hypothetical protein BGO21_00690 [Dyadobacter sp. 50-39]
MNASEVNVFNSLEYLLYKNKVKFTRSHLRRRLMEHQEPTSLAAVSEILDEYQVDHIASRLSIEKLSTISVPCMVFLDIQGGLFAPIERVSDDTVRWLSTEKGWQETSVPEFLQIWPGVTLITKPSAKSIEVNYKNNKRDEVLNVLRYPFSGLIISCYLLLIVFNTVHTFDGPKEIHVYAYIILNIIGSLMSGAVIASTLGTGHSYLRKLCSFNGQNTCMALTSSEGSKFLGIFSWAELGLFYFFGGILSCIASLVFQMNSLFVLTSALSFLTTPFIFYSLYFQGFRIRVWCRLCLATLLCFTLQIALTTQILDHASIKIGTRDASILFVCYSFLPVVWAIVAPYLKRSGEVQWLRREFNKMRFNRNYLRALFSTSGYRVPFFSDLTLIDAGKPESDHEILLITNPTCPACAQVHNEVRNVTERGKVKCRMLLIVPNRSDQLAMNVVRIVLSLRIEDRANAIDNWFREGRFDAPGWQAKFAVSKDMNSDAQIEANNRWAEMANIQATPIILINGSELPHNYEIRELNRIFALIG